MNTTINYQIASRFLLFLTALVLLLLPACQKFVETETPPDKISQSNVYLNDLTATTVLTGIYGAMSSLMTTANLAKYTGLLADEWVLDGLAALDPAHQAYYSNFFEASPTSSTGTEAWNSYYEFIFKCNAAIEGLNSSNSLSSHVKTQLLGESYFMRAWFYFYLVNLYGAVPLPLGTDPEVNRLLPRSSIQATYQLIADDLSKAQELLKAAYVNGQLLPYSGPVERIRPTKWAATAMLARVYLYQEQYAKAETASSQVIGQSDLYGLLPLPDIFFKNSQEAIWQLQPVDVGWNTQEGKTFHLAASPAGLSGDKPVHLSGFLLGAFEPGDQRRVKWVDSLISGGTTYYFPVKYKIGDQNPTVTSPDMLTEYSMVLRLAEQYLIRAEARARQNNLTGAIADVDMLRERAGLPLIADTNPGISQTTLLDLILHERQIELFTETGHRWFDLKRFGQINEVMSVVSPTKGGNWEESDQLLPIPYNELLRNPQLTQNSGY